MKRKGEEKVLRVETGKMTIDQGPPKYERRHEGLEKTLTEGKGNLEIREEREHLPSLEIKEKTSKKERRVGKKPAIQESENKERMTEEDLLYPNESPPSALLAPLLQTLVTQTEEKIYEIG